MFFSLAGPRDKQFAFAIRAKLGLTPQMDVGPYAHAHHAECCYETSLEDISVPAAEAKCPTVYDFVYFAR